MRHNKSLTRGVFLITKKGKGKDNDVIVLMCCPIFTRGIRGNVWPLHGLRIIEQQMICEMLKDHNY